MREGDMEFGQGKCPVPLFLGLDFNTPTPMKENPHSPHSGAQLAPDMKVQETGCCAAAAAAAVIGLTITCNAAELLTQLAKTKQKQKRPEISNSCIEASGISSLLSWFLQALILFIYLLLVRRQFLQVHKCAMAHDSELQ